MGVCQKCGYELVKDGAFCPECGTPVAAEPAAEATACETVQAPVVVEQPACGEPSLSAKATAIFAYMGWGGIILAVLLGDKKAAAFHINQALVVNIAFILCTVVCIIPILGWIVGGIGSIFFCVCWCMGLYYACKSKEKEVPVIGKYKLYK